MIFLADIGNSRVKIAYWTTNKTRVKTFPHPSNWHTFWKSALNQIKEPIFNAWVCSVSKPSATQALEQALLERKCRLNLFRVQAKYDRLLCGYADPKQLGGDRWAALLGAQALFDPPFIVIDAGTATTIDLVDASYTHLGGWIFPGSDAALSWLDTHTENLRKPLPAQLPSIAPGRTTRDALLAGREIAARAISSYALNLAKNKLRDSKVKAVLSGGNAQSIKVPENLVSYSCPNLVLYGLAVFVLDTMDSADGYETSAQQIMNEL